MKRWILMCLCVCFLLSGSAFADSMLSAQDLQAVQPEFEIFLEALADVLEQRGLLDADQREDWIAFQLGDYMQNGGYGTIAVMYNPDLLTQVEPDMMLLRRQILIEDWTLRLDTLRAFRPNASTLPGLPLEAILLTDDDVPVECRFRWYASSGQLLVWDGISGEVQPMGASVVTEGQPVYWQESPVGAKTETLTLELLAIDTDETLGEYVLTLVSDGQGWTVGEE